MKKVNKDPFSNGSNLRAFEYYCCDKCVKSTERKKYTKKVKNQTTLAI